ncbi:MAG: fumarylacetoacetate hydrolase family protein [Archaeoglobaceae archaeon]
MIGRFVYCGRIYEGSFEIDGEVLVYDGEEILLEFVKFLPPVMPSKIVAVGLNYVDHAAELNMPIPDEPIIFLKPPSAVIGDGDPILLPDVGRVDYEGELAVVIKKKCRDVRDTEDVILGYTCFNDVTAREIQAKDVQWTRAKSFDTFAPIGPYVAEIDPKGLEIVTRLNGKVVQKSTTANMIFDVYELVSFVSKVMTLYPGDVIATGTPAGVGQLKPGDMVEVEIEKIGVLRNRAVKQGKNFTCVC